MFKKKCQRKKLSNTNNMGAKRETRRKRERKRERDTHTHKQRDSEMKRQAKTDLRRQTVAKTVIQS